MNKFLRVLVSALVLVIVAQWFMFSRLRHKNDVLRDARTQVEQSRSELEATVESAPQRDTEAQSLRTDLAGVRGELQRVRQELDHAKKITPGAVLSPESSPELRPNTAQVPSAVMATPSRVELTYRDIDLGSLRVIRVDNGMGNLRIRLLGRSSDEIGAMAGIQKCDIVIDGQVATGAARWTEGGTNAGLVLAFDTLEKAMAAASVLRAPVR
jgi:hypothetical protein